MSDRCLCGVLGREWILNFVGALVFWGPHDFVMWCDLVGTRTLFPGAILEVSEVDSREVQEKKLHNFQEMSEELGDVAEVED